MSKTTEIYALIMYIKSTIALPSGTRINLPFKISEVSKIGAKLGKEPELIGIIFSNKKEAPAKEDINKIGLLASKPLIQGINLLQTNVNLELEPVLRIKVEEIIEIDGDIAKIKIAAAEHKQENLKDDHDIPIVMDGIKRLARHIGDYNNYTINPESETVNNKMMMKINTENNPGKLADKVVFACCPYNSEEKPGFWEMLCELDHKKRLGIAKQMLERRIKTLRVWKSTCLESDENTKKKQQALSLAQKALLLKKKINEIDPDHKLGNQVFGESNHSCQTSGGKTENKYFKRLENIKEHITEKSYEEFKDKIEDFLKLSQHDSGYSKKEEWLKRVLLQFPWGVYTKDCLDVKKTREILDRDHYGMEEIKTRMAEHVAVMALNEKGGGIILLYGPPGVEKIEQSSYTTQEKIKIGEKHLVRQAIKETGLILPDGKKMLELGDGIVKELVMKYVAESGVRELKRTISKLCRRFAMKINSMEIVEFPHIIKKEELIDYLGIPKARPFIAPKKMIPGESLGMAYSAIGGSVLSIETSVFEGTGRIKITGSIQEVMKESVDTALTTIRANIEEFKISAIDFSKIDIHIHVPAGATPKEGPSAGTAIATSVMSALRKEAIKPYISMTGELTSHGKVKAIGGLREKCIAAANAGIKTIILPRENEVNIKHEVPEEVKEKVNFIYVETLKEVIEKIFN